MYRIIQPILSSKPEYGHKPIDVLSFDEFNALLKIEEDYYLGKKTDLKLMTTRLRKIFYDKFGWNTQLIKKAACVKSRYVFEIVDCPSSERKMPQDLFKLIRRYKNYEYRPKCRKVTYRCNDRIYGNSKTGETPEIYVKDHQDVLLPEGYHCDVGHVLAGLDALNNFQPVSPLPSVLIFLRKYFPFVDSNADVVTWLGDIATTAADFLFATLRKQRPLTDEEEQFYINVNASASDMLGDIDSYVIHCIYYNIPGFDKKVSDILDFYYKSEASLEKFRQLRFFIFANRVGLKEWDGNKFSNEADWLNYYSDQLRNTTALMVFSSTKGLREKFSLPYKVWKYKYENVIKIKMLLTLFLEALKENMTNN
jgi:hypothetical protein